MPDFFDLQPGMTVRLVVPDNQRLDGTEATLFERTAWGWHTLAPAAATGRFRAGWEEFTTARPAAIQAAAKVTDKRQAREMGYTGEVCTRCQSLAVKRNGSCTVCDVCGETSGCS